MDLQSLRKTTQSKWKRVFERYNFPLSGVARHLGYSVPHTRFILNGHQKPNPKTRKRLDDLVEALKKEASV